MNQKTQVSKYIIADLMSAAVAWVLFYIFRKKFIEPLKFGYDIPFQFDERFYYGLMLIPLFWLALYALFGMYRNIYRRHRLRELGQVLLSSITGVIILFFLVLLDDEIASYVYYYKSLMVLFLLHFTLSFTLRIILTTQSVKRIHKRKIGFNTIIIGGNEEALNVYREMENMMPSPGFKFVGYVSVNGKDHLLQEELPWLGKFGEINRVIEEKQVEEVVIAIESSEHNNLGSIVSNLESMKVKIKIIPDIYDILSGSVKMSSIFGAPLIEINTEIMPSWQFFLKRLIDFFGSIFAIFILVPVYIILTILVKLSSPGPIFFKQERIGQHNRPFYIYKFRSMYLNSERKGPQLSSKHDPRITPIGRFMRKTRMDEIPQFFNVLKGDMSLVGPRPERQYYIDQIVKVAPHYRHLQKVKPGITSWGQVKYGYAENVEQMVARLKYDVLYIENMSLAIDIKILAYTIIIILKGSGK
ncbi:sugar transferase [Cryomorpha ignava]|uniref:Sugar transferase n=1 Tax=Cryomorpha ignava TaxID=101383 RepID=A0A7K3WKM1_9FLAO|nr:sugar transferase [Cryomorpha ignava]NEN22196.1 sugar transferase [Cryomorpha ignava]